MTVTEAIVNIKDRALFEQISVSILREIKPEYINIIHGGVNEKGETIASPLDAFHKINDNEFVLIEITTDDTNIKKKWLDNKEGDLIKASIKANEWRKSYPNARYTVWLCTNLRIKDDKYTQVFTQTITEANKYHLNVQFLEQSAIVDYLENNSTGQWLSEKHLGITARRLSKDKLLNLCQLNHEEYQREIYFDNSNIINRPKKKEFFDLVLNSYDANFLLLGESGFGKSTLMSLLLNDFLLTKQIGLRIKPYIVENSISITDAINRQLKEYQPNIMFIEDILMSLNHRILIVIDDINRTNNPSYIIEKILTWQRHPSFVIFCPIWNNVYNEISHRLKNKRSSLENNQEILFSELIFDKFRDDEALSYLSLSLLKRNIHLSKQQKEIVAKELSNNPFLLNIYCKLENLNAENYYFLTQNPIEAYFKEKSKEVEKNTSLIFYEIDNSLMKLSKKILENKTLNVSLVKNKNWFDGDDLKVLKEISKFKEILEIDEKGNIAFRHDKIRDYLLVRQIEQYLTSTEFDKYYDVLAEPYFAELIGKSLGNCLDINSKIPVIDFLLNHLPLSIFESLRNTQDVEKTNVIIQKLISWLEVNNSIINEAELDSIEKSLTTLDFPRIKEITKYFKEDHWILIANFRNGDLISGAKYLSSFDKDFEPTFGNIERDRMIEHFNLKFQQKGIECLKGLLQKNFDSIKAKNALIILAGYLKSSILFDYIYKMWLTDKEALLTSTIWALTNSLKSDYNEILTEVFDFWASLPKEDDKLKGAKNLATFYIGRSPFQQLSNNYIYFLLELSKNEKYSGLTWSFLVNADNPNAFEYVVSKLAASEKYIIENKGFGLILWDFPKQWNPFIKRGKQISSISMEKLQLIWSDKSRIKFERYQSFRLWNASTQSTHISILKSIKKNDDVIFKESLQRRLFLKDESALEDVINLIDDDNHDNSQWFKFLTFIWNKKTMSVFDKQIHFHKDKIKGDFSNTNSWILNGIGDSLKYIPNDDIDILLEKHWDKLGFDGNFIQLAVFIGTLKCRSLASESMKKCSNPKKVFDYFGIRLFHGLNSDNYHFESRKITINNLESIKPYFKYLKQIDLEKLLKRACELKLFKWVKDNLASFLQEHEDIHLWKIEDLLPTDEKLEVEFMEHLEHGHKRWWLADWVKRLSERDCDNNRLINILQKCLEKYEVSDNMIKCVGVCLENVGSRRDISILEEFNKYENFRIIIDETRYKLYRRTLI
jgi:hypothetical protein